MTGDDRGQPTVLVGIRFCMFVHEQHTAVIKQRAITFGNGFQLSDQVGELFHVPTTAIAKNTLRVGRRRVGVRVVMVAESCGKVELRYRIQRFEPLDSQVGDQR